MRHMKVKAFVGVHPNGSPSISLIYLGRTAPKQPLKFTFRSPGMEDRVVKISMQPNEGRSFFVNEASEELEVFYRGEKIASCSGLKPDIFCQANTWVRNDVLEIWFANRARGMASAYTY